MIEWKPCREGGLGAELFLGAFRAYLWAWPSVDQGAEVFCARVRVERGDDDADPFDRSDHDSESLDDAKKMAAELLQLYLDGDPDEQAFKAKLRAWVAPTDIRAAPPLGQLRQIAAQLKAMRPCPAARVEGMPCIHEDARWCGREILRIVEALEAGPNRAEK